MHYSYNRRVLMTISCRSVLIKIIEKDALMEERIAVEKSAMAKAADARAAIARAAVSVTESSLFAAEIEAEAAEAEAVSRRAWETAQVFPVFQIIITFLCMHVQNFA